MTLQLKQISIPPGQRLLLHDVSWQDFEAIVDELGNKRSTRLAYFKGTLEIVAPPLPEHERPKVIIADLLKILLDEFDLDWESLGSTTFKRQERQAGIEPDDCFYIQNHALMIGRDRIDLTINPPPDLAIGIDVPSRTKLSAYEALGVPEIWRYEDGKLTIALLQDGTYIDSLTSRIFPNFPAVEGITQYLGMSRAVGTRSTLKVFQAWVREKSE